MTKKPEGDLGSMASSKAKAASTPFATQQPAAPSAVGQDKSLTVKLKADTYAALRAYCYEQERATGTRVTHQQVMVTALKTFLGPA